MYAPRENFPSPTLPTIAPGRVIVIRSRHDRSAAEAMAPKAAVKKTKNVVVAASSKKSPDKLRARVAAAVQTETAEAFNPADALTDAELLAKNEERGWFGLPPLERTAGVTAPLAAPPATSVEEAAEPKDARTAPEAQPVAATVQAAPSEAPIAAPEVTQSVESAVARHSDGAAAAAGSALNAKRALDSQSRQPPDRSASPMPMAAVPTDANSDAASVPVPTDVELLEALKAVRKEMASKEKLATTMVVPTGALEQLTRLKVASLSALAQVPGFGVTRAERYGEPLLACIREHLAALKAANCEHVGLGEADGAGGAQNSTAPPPSAAEASAATCAGEKAREMVTVRYSHYRERFPLTHGGTTLDFASIDSKYMLSHVFKGHFSCCLVLQARGEASATGEAAAQIRPDGGRHAHAHAAARVDALRTHA